MNSLTWLRPFGFTLASALCVATSSVAAAENSPPRDDVASLKSQLAQVEDKLDMVLHSFTLTTQENDALKAQAEAALTQSKKELASIRAAIAARDADSIRLREILRQTQDTNAALAAENARLKTALGVSKPSPAGSYVPPAKANP